MDIIYYVILGMLAVLSVSGLIVGVSNDACNFLNSAVGCQAAKRIVVVTIASVGVVLGASFSSGMMGVARHDMFNPALFSFHDMMLLYLAVMVANIILMEIFYVLRLPTSTTVVLVFALLGSALGMALYSSGLPDRVHGVANYIRAGKAGEIVMAIFGSVACAFVLGSIVMWFSRLVFTFRYQKMYRMLGPLWCGTAFTAITYFAIFKGLAKSPLVAGSPMFDMLKANVLLFMVCAFVVWVIVAAILQYLLKVNTLRLTVLGGSFSLALSFAGNDLVNFIGPFMAALSSARDAMGQDPHTFMMASLEGAGSPADMIYLVLAGFIMVGVLFFSKRIQRISQTELKLSSSNTSKERFGSSQPARVLVRATLNTLRFVERVSPKRVSDFVGSRFAPLTPEEETGALYDQMRASVNLTIAAILISVATSFGWPLSTTYVTFMVAMGSSLADRAWGRDSAVYRITGVLTVVGGWFLTAFAATGVAFGIALAMAYGGVWGIIAMIVIALALLVKSFFFGSDNTQEITLINVASKGSVHDYGLQSSKHLKKMVQIYKAMVKDLLQEDRDGLKMLRKKVRSQKRDLENTDENEVQPTLAQLPREYAERGQLIYRISQISMAANERLLTLVKAAYNHIDNNHAGLNEAQGKDLLALVDKIDRFFPSLTDMLKEGNLAGIEAMLETTDKLSDDFADCITRHLVLSGEDESGMRNSILYLTLLNETRALVSHAFALIRRIKELFED
ncbi:MAG: inorganic phosphate transporter [Akkermansia sp.]|nr:inorganic phosphate transporter [Akkermansia sp.]